jgi:uncharacterized protein (TIGR02118 family)
VEDPHTPEPRTTTVLLARPPAPDADPAWLHGTQARLAARFPDAKVRLFVAEPDAGPELPPARFGVLLLVERARRAWPSLPPVRPADEVPIEALAGARGYRGRLRRVLGPAAPPRPGARAPGVVWVATLVRAPGLSHAAFDAHWRDHHAPLALRHHVGLSGYEQIALDRALTRDAPPLDGVALLQFPSHEALRDRRHDSDAGRAAIEADTKRFLDLARCEAACMAEYGVRG